MTADLSRLHIGKPGRDRVLCVLAEPEPVTVVVTDERAFDNGNDNGLGLGSSVR